MDFDFQKNKNFGDFLKKPLGMFLKRLFKKTLDKLPRNTLDTLRRNSWSCVWRSSWIFLKRIHGWFFSEFVIQIMRKWKKSAFLNYWNCNFWTVLKDFWEQLWMNFWGNTHKGFSMGMLGEISWRNSDGNSGEICNESFERFFWRNSWKYIFMESLGAISEN